MVVVIAIHNVCIYLEILQLTFSRKDNIKKAKEQYRTRITCTMQYARSYHQQQVPKK